MKRNLVFLMLTFTPIVFSESTQHDVVYGEDNRIDTIDSTSQLYQQLAKSSAAQIHHRNIQMSAEKIEFNGETLSDFLNSRYKKELCLEERFHDQPVISNCSGVLIGPDVIATAGHCYLANECQNYSWVFNYKINNKGSIDVGPQDIYQCKKIIKSQMSVNEDYALIQLDRKVIGRNPVKINKEEIKVGTSLVVIGHPSGLPQKIAEGAEVKSVSKTQYKANLDTFTGNSGSPVFNALTGELVGILSAGALDYRADETRGCLKVNNLGNEQGQEVVSKLSQFISN